MMHHQLPIIITNLLFLAGHCSDAYAPPPASSMEKSSRGGYRWSSSPLAAASTAAAASSSAVGYTTTGEGKDEKITTRDLLSLDYIRSTLIRQEETIIFALIERAQFRQNDICYEVGGVPGLGVPPGSIVDGDGGEELSFLDYMITGTVSAAFGCIFSFA